VVMHDSTVDRTTNGEGELAQLEFATVRALDAGYQFAPPGKPSARPWRGRGLQVPTLTEILNEFGEHRLNIDIKPNSLELASRVVAMLRDRKMETQVCLASWHGRVSRYLAETASEFCLTSPPLASLALLLSGQVGLPRELVPWDTLQIPVSAYGLEFVTEQSLEWYRSQSFDVHVWTIDSPGEMHRLAELGVDGIMTDRPSVLMETMSGR
jgi:glycerophosphoryl diester phosphodiesterase